MTRAKIEAANKAIFSMLMIAYTLKALGNSEQPIDPGVVAACADYLRVQRAFEAYFDTLPGDIEAGDPGLAMLNPIPGLVDRIVSLRATTPEGHLAHGQCLGFHYLPGYPCCQDDPDAATEDRFKAAMLRDLVALESERLSCHGDR